jgi:hypothetical protein
MKKYIAKATAPGTHGGQPYMKHKVGPQGLVVPFGYVTATIRGRVYVLQQGQYIPPDSIVTKVEGESEIEESRTAEALAAALGISVAPGGEPSVDPTPEMG